MGMISEFKAFAMKGNVVDMAVGVIIGGACARAMSGPAGQMLFGVTPADPGVFALAAAVLGATAIAAGWLSARRASNIDPMTALRHE